VRLQRQILLEVSAWPVAPARLACLRRRIIDAARPDIILGQAGQPVIVGFVNALSQV
jgi:hypothetical protein